MLKILVTAENISLILFFIGVYGICARRNILKSILGLSIMQASIVLFFISSRENSAIAPIGTKEYLSQNLGAVSDPVPQALMITAVVIGISVTAMCLTMFVSLFHKYGTTNWKKVKEKRGVRQ